MNYLINYETNILVYFRIKKGSTNYFPMLAIWQRQ